MARIKRTTSFVCQECGYDTPQWLGKCPECGVWNSLKEITITSSTEASILSPLSTKSAKPKSLSEIVFSKTQRIQTNFTELNTVLGGGIVPGSAILLAGDPGVGKSTLLLQLCLSLAEQGKKVLYISGEESEQQIKMRATRLMANGKWQREKESAKTQKKTNADENLFIFSSSDPDIGILQLAEQKPDLFIVDSIQTMQSQNVAGLAGSVGQVRYAALQYIRVAKSLQTPMVLVGHVTKEGTVAGPMVLSHMVDTVLFLEGEKLSKTRLLRS